MQFISCPEKCCTPSEIVRCLTVILHTETMQIFAGITLATAVVILHMILQVCLSNQATNSTATSIKVLSSKNQALSKTILYRSSRIIHCTKIFVADLN